jgi:hypothetical protein
MNITPLIKEYLSIDAHLSCMRRASVKYYDMNEQLLGMYTQLCVHSSREHLVELYSQMDEKERLDLMDWLFL